LFCTADILSLAGLYTHLYTGPVPDKMLVWIGASFEELRDFPPEARRAAGYELRRIQRGSMPTDWKPMPSVGPGVNEIRIHTHVEHRVMYVAKFEEAVYVLHAFEKRSRQTRDTDLTLARERLKQVEAFRREERRRR
jgi:phage-related protein